jgi:hypothetical protein
MKQKAICIMLAAGRQVLEYSLELLVHISIPLKQGCTSAGNLIANATKFLMVDPNNCGDSVWNFLPVIHHLEF